MNMSIPAIQAKLKQAAFPLPLPQAKWARVVYSNEISPQIQDKLWLHLREISMMPFHWH